jgi:hypothetical protein
MNNNPLQPNLPEVGEQPLAATDQPVEVAQPAAESFNPQPTVESQPATAAYPSTETPAAQFDNPPVAVPPEQPAYPLPLESQPAQEPYYPPPAPQKNIKNLVIAIAAALIIIVVIITTFFFVSPSSDSNNQSNDASSDSAVSVADQDTSAGENDVELIKNIIMRKWSCYDYNIDTGETAADEVILEYNPDWTFLEYETNNTENYYLTGTFKLKAMTIIDQDGERVESYDSSGTEKKIYLITSFTNSTTGGETLPADQLAELNSAIAGSDTPPWTFMVDPTKQDSMLRINNSSLNALACTAVV